MDFSDQWRAAWCIGSVFSSPQLITGSSAESLGPLLFELVGDPLPLFSADYKSDFLGQIHLNPNEEVDQFLCQHRESFVPYNILHQYVAEDMQKKLIGSLNLNLFLGNRLQGLKSRGGMLRLFFPVGTNMSHIGSICFDKGSERWDIDKQLHNLETNVMGRQLCKVSSSIHHPIKQLAVVGKGSFVFDDSTEGFLLARTTYAVHWFRAESKEGDHTLKHIAVANFKTGVSHACWNPHLPEESAVILENGELYFFDISSCAESSNFPVKLKGKVLPVELAKVRANESALTKNKLARKKYWQGLSEFDGQSKEDWKESWWRCEYGWHPRILLVAGWNEVRLVDFRTKKENCSDYSTIIARVNCPESSYCSCSARHDRFVSFVRADYDMFKFAIATQQHILLFDSRQPLTPILQWEHGLKDCPGYLHMLRLSDLRPSVSKEYKWATDSGHAILAASFRSGDMRVFCYGPRPSEKLNACKAGLHVAQISSNMDIPDVLYSWNLPSKLFTVNGLCSENNENDLRIQGDSHSTNFMYPKISKSSLDAFKESICGFYIVSDHPSYTPLSTRLEESEQNTPLGFRLLQLTGTGELLSQQFQPSKKLISKTSRTKGCSEFETPYNANLDLQRKAENLYKRFPCFLSYLKTNNSLNGQLSSNLASGVVSCKQNGKHSLKSTGCALLRKLIESWQASYANDFGFPPPLKDLIHQIGSPFSIYEISCERLWMSLPLDLLEMAFALYSEFPLLGRSPPDFLQIFPANRVQMPLFDLCNLPKGKKRLSSKQNDDHLLLGPMLPLPFLLDFQQRQEMISGSFGVSPMSAQMKIKGQCHCILNELNNLKGVNLIPEVGGSTIVSLEDDNDLWPSQQVSKDENYLLVHDPSANSFEKVSNVFKNSNLNNDSEDIGCKQKYDTSVHDTFIGSVFGVFSSGNNGRRPIISELGDDISINLSFAVSEVDLKLEELEGLRRLKQQCQEWQKGFQLYQNYLDANVYRVA